MGTIERSGARLCVYAKIFESTAIAKIQWRETHIFFGYSPTGSALWLWQAENKEQNFEESLYCVKLWRMYISPPDIQFIFAELLLLLF